VRTGTRGTGRPAPVRAVNRKWRLALGGLFVVFVVLAGYALIFGGALSGGSSASPKAKASSAATTPSSPVTPSSPATSLSPSSPALSPVGSSAQTLTVASAAAFGPEGTSDGDNPGIVSRVVDGGGAWYSSWYATPEFGNLQSGTGILLDMGQAVSVSSVGLVLGDAVGTNVQVRVGDTAVLGDMSTAASVSDVGGTVQVPLTSPASARYVLIWFTKLPPTAQGTYQVSVYNATVDGRA
jgi:eukaryotic-like serine/threonine-protein kinase